MGRAAIRGVKYDKDEYIKEIKEYTSPPSGEHKHLTTQEFAQRINAAGLTKEDLLNLPKGEMVSYFVMREIKKIIERKVDKDFPPGSQISIELHGPPPPPPPPPTETYSGMDRAERRELWRLIDELSSQYEEEEDEDEDEDEEEAPVPDNQAVLRIGSDGKFHRYEPGPALEQARAKPARRDLPQISFVSMGAHIGDK